MDPIRLKLALKRRPAVDAVLRSAAWPVLQAQRLGADWAAWRRGRGAYDPEFAWLPPLQGKYRGRSCFVVGTGPSLCLEDLERIRPAYSFGVNAAVLALGQTGWRPDFYLIQDEYVYQRLEAALALAASSCQLKAVWVGQNIARRFPLPVWYKTYPLHLLDHRLLHRRGWGTFRCSADCYRCVYDGYSVVFSALQLAAYLGFGPIFLLGCDCDYAQPRTHFIPCGIPQPRDSGQRIIQGHRAFWAFARQRGLRVYNCTRGGALEVYPRIPLEQAVRHAAREGRKP